MEQCLNNWKWNKTVPETLTTFNELVHIWKQRDQQTTTFQTPTQHAILEQIVRKMTQWTKKHMQEYD